MCWHKAKKNVIRDIIPHQLNIMLENQSHLIKFYQSNDCAPLQRTQKRHVVAATETKINMPIFIEWKETR